MQIPTPSGEIGAYLSVPQPVVSGPAPWPGVVVIHDAIGLSDDIRAIADRFATAGYVALAPDLYSRGGLMRCVKSVFTQMYAGSGRAFDDIDAARQVLADRDDCSGKVGIAGFCMGGGFALIAAAQGFDASAPYYGELPKDLSALDGACPVVASFGAKDRVLRGAAGRLEVALTERDVVHDVHGRGRRPQLRQPAPVRSAQPGDAHRRVRLSPRLQRGRLAPGAGVLRPTWRDGSGLAPVVPPVEALAGQGGFRPGLEVLCGHPGPVGGLADLGVPDPSAQLGDGVSCPDPFGVVGAQCAVPVRVGTDGPFQCRASCSALVAPLPVWGRVMVPASPTSRTRPLE